MNIFYIPSSYPTRKEPISGIFFKEQALAIGRHLSPGRIIVSRWHDNEYPLPLNNPLKSFKSLWRYFYARSSSKKIAKNVWEFYHPSLEWSQKIFDSYTYRLIKTNEKNFLAAQKKFGKIDLIHAQVCFPAGFTAMKLAEKYHRPYIITEHMGPFPFSQFLIGDKLSFRIAEPFKKATLIIAVSPSLEDKLKKYGIKKTLYLPNMVDEKYFYPIKKPSRRKNFTFFTLARICPEKGIGDLLTAISEVIKKKKNVIFRIGGDGSHLEKYRRLTIIKKLEKNIRWLGLLSRSRVRKELQNCQAFVLSSHHESFGVVYAEALACGKPVVATRCGGPEAIVNEDNGLLVEVGNIRALSKAILKMMETIDFYQSDKIREDFLQRFSQKVIAREIVNIYQSLLYPEQGRRVDY